MEQYFHSQDTVAGFTKSLKILFENVRGGTRAGKYGDIIGKVPSIAANQTSSTVHPFVDYWEFQELFIPIHGLLFYDTKSNVFIMNRDSLIFIQSSFT